MRASGSNLTGTMASAVTDASVRLPIDGSAGHNNNAVDGLPTPPNSAEHNGVDESPETRRESGYSQFYGVALVDITCNDSGSSCSSGYFKDAREPSIIE